MHENSSFPSRYTLTRLSAGPEDAPWSIAVFAHNEAGNIATALNSIASFSAAGMLEIYVLANGCTDATVERVRESAATIDNLWLVEIGVADKAEAWNLYVQDVLSQDRVDTLHAAFFMDGDVTLASDALPLLASVLEEEPGVEAVGAMPATGRDKDAWRRRMVAYGMLAGNCYALHGWFLEFLRERQVRMPIGLIGEDFLVSWLVASDDWRANYMCGRGVRCVFQQEAQFYFRSLSPWHWRDCRTYLRRKWRYTLRGLQHVMLVNLLSQQGLEAMPRDVGELYQRAAIPPRAVWVGLVDTPLRLAALQWMRRQRDRGIRAHLSRD